jgi:Flp pilus assembly pilin Flp
VCGALRGLDQPAHELKHLWRIWCPTDLVAREAGQDVAEYGLLIATIAIFVLLGISAFGGQVQPWFEQLAARITTVGT